MTGETVEVLDKAFTAAPSNRFGDNTRGTKLSNAVRKNGEALFADIHRQDDREVTVETADFPIVRNQQIRIDIERISRARYEVRHTSFYHKNGMARTYQSRCNMAEYDGFAMVKMT